MKASTYRIILIATFAIMGVATLCAQAGKQLKPKNEDVHAFIKTIVSKKQVHVSDTLTLTYRLYTAVFVDRLLEDKFPQVNGNFYTNTLHHKRIMTEEEIDGILYYVFDLRTQILQPRSAGDKVIPEGAVLLQYKIATGETKKDLFENDVKIIKLHKQRLDVDSVTIHVHNI